MMKRILSFFLGAALIVALAVPASAEDSDNWTQVLNFSTVNDSGSNYFVVNKSAIITLQLPMRTYGVWIDMLVSTSDMDIKSVYSIWNSSYSALTVKKVDTGLFRVYGRMSYHTYTELKLEFNCTGTGYYELLSCRICSLTADGTTATVTGTLTVPAGTYNFGLAQLVDVPGRDDGYVLGGKYEAVISIKDATKYDTLTVYGSVDYASINSIRATYGGLALEYTCNFIDVENNGVFWGEGYEVSTHGKFIYAINIDLAKINRSQEQYVLVYIGGDFNRDVGMVFNCQTATGYVTIADSVDASWWTRFTTFMEDLFGSNSGSDALNELDGTSDSISQSASDIHNFEQSQQAVLDNNFSVIQNTITFTNFAAALVFVQKYANLTVSGISKYMVVFTLPLFLGLFFFLCSRVPGITRWKTRPPQKKGGNSP